MKNTLWIAFAVVVVAAAGFFLWPKHIRNGIAADYKNGTYSINGRMVTLVNGHAETDTGPNSVSKEVTQYFGDMAEGDLNGDGQPDVAFLLTQSGAGSGTFYYVVAAIKTTGGYQGTNAIFIGDRIAPQTTEIQNGEVIVNYADRAANEPMTAAPSVAHSRYFVLSGPMLKESPRIAGAGAHCGGNMMNAPICAEGYHCAPAQGSHLPFGDVGGTCVVN